VFGSEVGSVIKSFYDFLFCVNRWTLSCRYVSSTDLVSRLHIRISTETCCIPIGDFCLLIHVGGYVFVIGLQDLSECSEEETAFKTMGGKSPS